MEVQPKQIERYVTSDGKIPFDDWFNALRDRQAQAKIRFRLKQVALGNLGDYKGVGEGVCELRIDYGPGYRIYIGQIGSNVIILLCGGNKNTQTRDIQQAIQYWQSYRS